MKQSYIVLLLLLLALSYGFSLTDGFVYSAGADGGLIHARDTYSSSSNDDLVVEGGLLWFSVPLLLKVVRLKKEIGVVDLAVFAVAWLIQLLSLTAVDSSIGLTLRQGRNLILLLWFFTYFALVPVSVVGFSKSRIEVAGG